MKQTANFKLNKPDYNDVADIADINNNMDIVDAAMYEHNFNKNNPHGVTKVQIGLGNVDNTADKNKSVLSATTASKLTATRLTNESLNSVIEVGDYWGAGGNTVTDFPDGASTNSTTVGGFALVVNQAGGSGKLQIYTSDKGTWFRTGSISETAAAWNGWIKVYNSSNPVKINGTIFSGTMDITVPAAPIFTALSGKDLNAITENGFYGGGSGNNCSNLPKGVSVFLLIVSKNSNTGYTQIIVDSATQYMYIRNLINQNWQDWRNVSISVNSIPHYSYNEKIADGLDVYSIISPGKNMTLDVNKNYSVGDSFGIIFTADYSEISDNSITLTYGGKTIHSGILDDADSVAITDFDGGVLYKVTLKDTGYICERSEASTIVTINTDSQLNSNDVFFLDFNYTSGTINTGIEMQINYNGIMSTASYIYDTNNKRVTIAETNRMYLIKKRIDGFYMMKIG